MRTVCSKDLDAAHEGICPLPSTFGRLFLNFWNFVHDKSLFIYLVALGDANDVVYGRGFESFRVSPPPERLEEAVLGHRWHIRTHPTDSSVASGSHGLSPNKTFDTKARTHLAVWQYCRMCCHINRRKAPSMSVRRGQLRAPRGLCWTLTAV